MTIIKNLRAYGFLSIMTIIIIASSNQSATAKGLKVQESRPISGDTRFRTYVYNPNQIYKYTGFYRYQSSIQFERGETIGTITIGDPTAWQIVDQGSRLFMKPTEQDATTNMMVMTNKRVYHFELYAETAEDIRDKNLVFVAKFIYPNSESSSNAALRQYSDSSANSLQTDSLTSGIPDIVNEPEKYNFNYSVTGSRMIQPLKIFDDGEFTYMEFRKVNADLPAIFQVTGTGSEALINYRITGDYIVVERVSSQYTLRYGDEVACIFNESSPLVRTDVKKEKKFLGIF